MSDELTGEDIGHGVFIRPFTIHGDERQAGITVAHRHPDGKICRGSVPFDVPATEHDPDRPKWTVEQLEPLTISPSVHNTDCGLHGFIREGRWVPA